MVEKHQWSHYADFYRESAYSVFRQEHRDVRGRTPFRMIEVEQTDHDFSDPDVPECVLAMPLSASAENRWSWDMGDGWRNDSAVPGRILVLPAGVESRWRVRGRRNLLLLTIPSSTLRRILGAAMPDDPTGALRPLAQCTWEDQLVQQLMLCLWHASLAGNATDRLLVDGAMTTLVSHVLQRAGIEERPARHVTLAAWRLKRVHEFVDAHLHEEIDIVTLSEAAGLSVRHFTRAFREEVGVTPHRWLMARRIERAMELIRHGDQPLTQIARSCGFAAKSHFTRVFRQVTGEPPKRWQQLHRTR